MSAVTRVPLTAKCNPLHSSFVFSSGHRLNTSMNHNVLVAEPDHDTWTSIAHGVTRRRPGAAILRVKDGEQALRLLFRQGLLMDQPETPDLIVLGAELSIVPTDTVLARIRQHPRTQKIPVIIVERRGAVDNLNEASEDRKPPRLEPSVVVISGIHKLEKEVASAIHEFSAHEDAST